MDKKLRSHVDIVSRDGVDLNMYQCGIEACEPSHGFGPALRDHYLIHYILEGSGTFYMNHKKYSLTKGQGFLIPPNIVTYYQADHHTPWTYIWVGFHGLKAESFLKRANLTSENPIFISHGENLQNYMFQMIEADRISTYNDLELTGLLFLFMAELVKQSPKNMITNNNSKEIYVKQAIAFIENNYSRIIQIRNIADHLSIDRSYFSNIFKESVQKSPQQFLLEYRMNKACELLKDLSLPINTIAHSVGYVDPFNFSKMFKKIKGQSPTGYRESINQ